MKKIPMAQGWSKDSRFASPDFGAATADYIVNTADPIEKMLKMEDAAGESKISEAKLRQADLLKQYEPMILQAKGLLEQYKSVIPAEAQNALNEINKLYDPSVYDANAAKALAFSQQQEYQAYERQREAQAREREAQEQRKRDSQQEADLARRGQEWMARHGRGGSGSDIAMRGVGCIECYPSLGAALADSCDPEKDANCYGPVDPRTEVEKIRDAAEEAEAQYDAQMQTRREAEDAEAEYDRQQKTKQAASVALPIAVIALALLFWPKSKVQEVTQ